MASASLRIIATLPVHRSSRPGPSRAARSRTLLCAALALSGLHGCRGSSPRDAAGSPSDGGTRFDQAPAVDAGVPDRASVSDRGSVPDRGSGSDRGSAPDRALEAATSPSDGGIRIDQAPIDAGAPDHGSPPDSAPCSLGSYPLGVPFSVSAPTALPFAEASTRYAALVLHEGEGAEVTAALDDQVVGNGAVSPFPGALPPLVGFPAPAGPGAFTGGPFSPTVPAALGQTAAVSLIVAGVSKSVQVKVVFLTPSLTIAEDISTLNPAGAVSATALQQLADAIDKYVSIRHQVALGPLTDVDGNGRLVVVLSAALHGTGVGGYTNYYDLVFPAGTASTREARC